MWIITIILHGNVTCTDVRAEMHLDRDLGSGRVGSLFFILLSLSIKHAVVGIEIDQAVVVGSQQRTYVH